MNTKLVEIKDVQNADGDPLDMSDFRREYIGLRGELQTNATDPERKGRMCFTFVDAKDGAKYEIRSSRGYILEQNPSMLIFQTKNARYIFTLS